MNDHVVSIETVIDYIETHLDGKIDLEQVSEAVHYSKYHLHRMFTNTVGMTMHLWKHTCQDRKSIRPHFEKEIKQI